MLFISSFSFALFFFPLPCLCQVIMAHPSSYVSLPPDRSGSRDDPPMWSHPTPDRPRNPRHHESWNYTTLLRHTRRALVIIDLEQVQHLMSARQSDVMQATTCDALPSLGRLEQYALFTYSFLVTPAQTQFLTVDTILYYIHQSAYQQHLGLLLGTFLYASSLV